MGHAGCHLQKRDASFFCWESINILGAMRDVLESKTYKTLSPEAERDFQHQNHSTTPISTILWPVVCLEKGSLYLGMIL